MYVSFCKKKKKSWILSLPQELEREGKGEEMQVVEKECCLRSYDILDHKRCHSKNI